MKIGITGPNGRLGSALVRSGCIPLNSDILATSELNDEIKQQGIEVVINCAAFTQVDRCEDERTFQQVAIPVNALGAYRVYQVCHPLDIPLVHISSDYVFGGRFGPYTERDPIRENDPPVNNYGLTKLGAEAMLLSLPGDVYIVRTTGLYSGLPVMADFLTLVLARLTVGQTIDVTGNLYGNQTYVPHLVDGLLSMIRCIETSSVPKVLHIASREVVTRYEFARMIADQWGLDRKLIQEVTSQQIPSWIATRPEMGGLVTQTAIDVGIPIYKISEGLQHAHENWNRYPAV